MSQMKTEGLGQPDQIIKLTVRDIGITVGSQRVANGKQIRQKLVRPAVASGRTAQYARSRLWLGLQLAAHGRRRKRIKYSLRLYSRST